MIYKCVLFIYDSAMDNFTLFFVLFYAFGFAVSAGMIVAGKYDKN